LGWGNVRRRKWNDCKGICEWCGQPIRNIASSCLHHRINRSQGGRSDYDNAELRHRSCEYYAHANYKFGNREGNLKRGGRNERKGRRNRSRYSQESHRTSVPILSGEGTVHQSPEVTVIRKEIPNTIVLELRVEVHLVDDSR